MANKAFKFRMYPNAEQKLYEETKQKLNNTPAQYKSEFEWLKEVDMTVLLLPQMNLQKAYNNFFRSPKVGFPKFKSKKSNRLHNELCQWV